MQTLRPWLLAGIYGMIAGAITAVTLYLMKALEHLLWAENPSRLYIFGVIMVGGVILALLRYISPLLGVSNDPNINAEFQLDEIDKNVTDKRRSLLLLALSAIVAVGFGGAVGPEAGLIAVVGEASILIGLLMAKNQAESCRIAQIGDIASLSAFYVAPPASVLLTDPATVSQSTMQQEKTLTANSSADSDFPLAQKVLASVAGLDGFVLIAQWLLPERAGKLPLPPNEFSFNSLVVSSSYELLLAIVPALLGAVIGMLYVKLLPVIKSTLGKIGSSVVQILIGTFVFALLACAFPLLRFSGHEELYYALEHGIHSNAWELVVLGVLKVAALCVCLASGWKGGAIFPLIFAGASVGVATALVFAHDTHKCRPHRRAIGF